MQDPADTVTLDLLSAPKKRGRPPTGAAKSPAERKREQRERVRFGLVDALADPAKMAALPTAVLAEGLAVYVSKGFPAVAADIVAELMRRAVENQNLRSQNA